MQLYISRVFYRYAYPAVFSFYYGCSAAIFRQYSAKLLYTVRRLIKLYINGASDIIPKFTFMG